LLLVWNSALHLVHLLLIGKRALFYERNCDTMPGVKKRALWALKNGALRA
jgi:hypothetical protein